MKDYFQQCSAEAAECYFQCPMCEGDLSDYMLLRKLVVGLSDPVLKKEVFQGCPAFTSVEKLHEKCFTHKAAVRDSGEWCRASAASHLPLQPRLEVKVAKGTHSIGPTSVLAVADTGAMVCVADTALMSKLRIRTCELRKCRDLRDVADMRVQCIGYTTCHISSGDRSTRQKVYFVHSAKDLYFSLGACKGLGLVPKDFPRHTQFTAEAACSEEALGNEVCQVPPRPTEAPFSPLEENVARLEGWLQKHFSSTTFNTTRSPLPVMAGPPHRILLVSGALPRACHTPAAVPKHWEAEVKAQLDEDVTRGVIESVPAGEATEWCARMVVVAKKNGQPRRTIDFQLLNSCCKRETHQTAAPFDMVSGIPERTFKPVADAFWVFHQVSLDVESRRLTTFIAPLGRYRYRRSPMGHCSASDAYTRRFDDAIQDIPRKFKCVDDTMPPWTMRFGTLMSF